MHIVWEKYVCCFAHSNCSIRSSSFILLDVHTDTDACNSRRPVTWSGRLTFSLKINDGPREYKHFREEMTLVEAIRLTRFSSRREETEIGGSAG